MKQKLNIKKFIFRSEKLYKNLYDYSLVKYTDYNTKVKIICYKYGIFFRTPGRFLEGRGCPSCGREKASNNHRLNTREFINKAKEIHKNKYNYSLASYKSCFEKVKIICPIHGIYEQKAELHLRGQGCKKCGIEKLKNLNSSSGETFINKAKKLHKDKYNYSLVSYKNNSTKVDILCKKHGVFKITPSSILSGHGCSKCSHENLSKKFMSNTNDFIKKSKQIHGSLYDYSLVRYKGVNKKVKIICLKHGIFEQSPTKHLSGHGCYCCKKSRGEMFIAKYLRKNNIVYITEKCFKNCRKINPLPFDFYIPSINTCIEYDGPQHFLPVQQFGGEKNFEDQKVRDKIKDNFCLNNNIKLIRITYKDNKFKVEKILNDIIK